MLQAISGLKIHVEIVISSRIQMFEQYLYYTCSIRYYEYKDDSKTFCIFKWLTIFASNIHLIIFRIKRKYVSDLIAVFTEYYGNREEINGSLVVGMAQKLYTSGQMLELISNINLHLYIISKLVLVKLMRVVKINDGRFQNDNSREQVL